MLQLSGAVLEYLQDRFKGALSIEEDDVVTGAALAAAIGGDGDRVSITFANLGANPIFLSPSLDVSATHGLRLGPTGGMVSMNVEEDSLLPAVQWYAISPAGASNLYILSVRRTRLSTS